MSPISFRVMTSWISGLAVLLLVNVAAADPQPVNPQPAPNALKPGLAVTYYYGFNRHINEVAKRIESEDGEVGEPLAWLNYRSGSDLVLTSDKYDGVGAHIQGLIHFDEVGTYAFAIESNDGVRFSVSDEMLIEDPDVHADQWSNVATVDIKTAGWYPMEVLYFERKNTSTLRLVWKKPPADESQEFSPVPEAAFAHTAGE